MTEPSYIGLTGPFIFVYGLDVAIYLGRQARGRNMAVERIDSGTVVERYMSPDEVCALIPGMTRSNLANLRYLGRGPKFLKPTPRTVVYQRSSVIAWLEASEQTITGSVAV